MEGDNRCFDWFAHAARSRLVVKRYFTPSPAADWRAGKIQRANTAKEESYVQAILRICEKEEIDTIFPSFDPHVYVFSKNKERFERSGVLIPIPDYDPVINLLDKYRTVQAAREIGFPCPKTYLAESEEDLKRISEELGFPLVIKPRCTAGGRGFEKIGDLSALLAKRQIVTAPGSYMIQEFIPGKQEEDLILVLDTHGVLKMAFADKRFRAFSRLHQNSPTANESLGSRPYAMHAAKLGKNIGWWGSMTVQMKIDSRDGAAKLLEINPRMGWLLWLRVAAGINEPWMCLKIAKGEEVPAVKDYPAGTMFLYPVEDLLVFGLKLIDLLVYKFRINVQGRSPIDPLNPPLSIGELMRSYKETYFNRKKKLYNFYFTYFFNDSLVSMFWWIQTVTAVWRAARELGR
jgi:predicted ATP-grasp superfamily ATP-dependent carboligase